MRNRFLIACIAMIGIATSSIAKAENGKPFVIPELRQWQGAEGMAVINAKSKVLYADATLQQAAEAMAEDYGLLFGKALKAKATTDATKVAAGSIVITLTNDEELGDEGYNIEIGDYVAISANTSTGAYWATRTLLQILEQNEGANLPKGSVRDWPDYAIRGFMIDCGRKYIPLDYLKEYAKIMAYYMLIIDNIH